MAKSTWNVDASHSAIEFVVKHMMISNVRGSFHSFEANVIADPEDLTTAEIDFSIDVNSIDTRDEGRDNHLRSADFFDVENFPKLTFKSTNITKKGQGEYDLTGDITIRGVTKPLTFHVTYEGGGKDPWGGERAGYSAKGSLSRKDFGLTWNSALETGGVLVGDEVKLNLEIEAVKQG
ncbi:YceI family protein [Alicyclobacillus dauci]|uniref:YceI family protein n=1 Tax=Alicyclobacillus dauci TaxID=1475485 RepID=A0ABY6YZP3_9BACL|nr:YceI family protein [Alicyclobacillus dauci]WAH36094.1 YceI family protein [Alicyclobacillus dauci]